ncbi:hypothetical protein B0T18DRAFT_78817 [Schizothecium vesticola]|uniref:Uncharacterized protein n=1 Tax=Schizothecium vesticola TaxID=314040 RepID=A0AA40KAT1_9PEZI|nr:hypothetical protein B0T18DRAFT_78817 [Schizothecium vesticola]
MEVGVFGAASAAFPFYWLIRGLYHGLAMASGRLGRKILHLVMVAGASLAAWAGHNDGVWRVGLVIAFLGIGRSGFSVCRGVSIRTPHDGRVTLGELEEHEQQTSFKL